MNMIMKNDMYNALNKVGFELRKHSPEILAVVGVIGVVTSTVLACKATTKANDILTNAKKDIETIHTCQENEKLEEEYTEADVKKDLTIVYIQTGIKLVKTYAPAVIVGALSISGLLMSNNILRRRNVALAAAYTTVDRSFKSYRKRVVDRFGKEVDHELRHDIKAKTIEKTIIDEKGKEKKVEETVQVVGDINPDSDYSRFFDSACSPWEKDPELNLMFLRAEQNLANDRLRSRGYLFLNEVYDRLDIAPTKAGQEVGWIYDIENPLGDNFVDFGIYDARREFINGYEPTVLLNFNVDGSILNRFNIEKVK